jgi:hypothetical protein
MNGQKTRRTQIERGDLHSLGELGWSLHYYLMLYSPRIPAAACKGDMIEIQVRLKPGLCDFVIFNLCVLLTRLRTCSLAYTAIKDMLRIRFL